MVGNVSCVLVVDYVLRQQGCLVHDTQNVFQKADAAENVCSKYGESFSNRTYCRK